MSKPKKFPLALAAGEQVVDHWPGGSVSMPFVHSGRVWLTNRRIVFQPVVLWVFWLAPLVGLVLWLMAKPHWKQVALADILAHQRTTFGRNPNIFMVATKTGEVKLLVDQYDAFAAAFAQQKKAA